MTLRFVTINPLMVAELDAHLNERAHPGSPAHAEMLRLRVRYRAQLAAGRRWWRTE